MTHLRGAAQVDCLILLHLIQPKFAQKRFFSFFDSLRHGFGELPAQYPNLKT